MHEPHFEFRITVERLAEASWRATVHDLPGCSGVACNRGGAVRVAMATALRTLAARIEADTADAALLNGLFVVETEEERLERA